jgi:hypothetical protein
MIAKIADWSENLTGHYLHQARKAGGRLIPASSDCSQLIGSMKGKIRVHGNILWTGLDWQAES